MRPCFLPFFLSGPKKNPYISWIHKDFSIFFSLFIRALRAENENRTFGFNPLWINIFRLFVCSQVTYKQC